MSGMMTAAAIAVLAAVLALTLRPQVPALAFTVGLAALAVLLARTVAPLTEVVQTMGGMMEGLQSTGNLYVPVLKTVVIAAVVRLAGAVCRDAGQSALAAQLELAGTAAAIAVCLPLFGEVIELVTGML